MSDYDNGRPPVPGMDQTARRPAVQGYPEQNGSDQGYAGQTRPAQGYPGQTQTSQAGRGQGYTEQTRRNHGFGSQKPTSNHPKPDKHKGGGVKPAIVGALGGVVGALVVALVLYLAGFGASGGTSGSSGSGTSESSAGQTVSITTDAEDVTVAQAAAAKALPSVVVVNVTTSDGSGLGSGVIYDTDGNIITNYHVIEDATAISVTIDNKSYDAEVVGSDASSDIAVIKVDLGGTEVTPIEVGDSDALTVGEWVMTVGSPFGLDQSVSAGIVSSLARNQILQSTSGNTLYTNLIQTDAAINPGNSGGALVNSQGQLVGICTLFSSDTESFAGIGFAIPGNYATQIADKIIAGETVTHAYIGLTMQTVNAYNAEQNGLAVNQGAYVAEVTSGSPADEAGIEEGDIIIGFDGEEITSADGMILAVRSHDIGDTVEVTLMRGDEEMTVEVTLSDDAQLQAQQQEELERQQEQTEGYGYGGNGDGYGGNGYSQEDMLEELYEYLYDNHGGSYDTGLNVEGEAA